MEHVEDAATAIERLISERRALSDAAVLDELRGLDPLPSDQGATWQSEASSAWQRAHILLALAELAAQRGLAEAVPLVLERMCFGDPGELMRGVRHSLEEAVRGDWELLARQCQAACASPAPGARLWAADELAVLRDPLSVPTLIGLLDDPIVEIAEKASFGLSLIVREHPEVRTAITEGLIAAIGRRPHRSREMEKCLAEVRQGEKDA